MASIPHGTTIEAQGTFDTKPAPPNIHAVDITPSLTGSNPIKTIRFASQTAADPNTPRIPQDLSRFIAAGTITQALLDDPNKLLRDHISKQKITSTTTIIISTAPPPPVGFFGGGTDNIAFLLGQAAANAPNAQAVQMVAVFWIETVEEVLLVPPYHVGEPPPFALRAKRSVQGQRVPTVLRHATTRLGYAARAYCHVHTNSVHPDGPAEFCWTYLAACLGEHACARRLTSLFLPPYGGELVGCFGWRLSFAATADTFWAESRLETRARRWVGSVRTICNGP